MVDAFDGSFRLDEVENRIRDVEVEAEDVKKEQKRARDDFAAIKKKR